jgi:hypothetical protein
MAANDSITYRLEKALQETLKERMPKFEWLAKADNPEAPADKPYGAVQCDRAEETTPESGVYYVQTAILVTHFLGDASGREHHQIVSDTRQALEMIPTPCADETWQVRVYGLTIGRVTPADTEQEQGTLFELVIGCGVMEKQEGGPVNTPDSEV